MGRIDEVIQIGAVAHHLLTFTQEIVDGRWEASFYADPNRAALPAHISPTSVADARRNVLAQPRSIQLCGVHRMNHSQELMATVAERRRLFNERTAIRIGSEEHKELFCRFFLETHDPYKPAVISWPKLDDQANRRLTSLPIWRLAVETEGYAGLRMEAMADATEDPLIREASPSMHSRSGGTRRCFGI